MGTEVESPRWEDQDVPTGAQGHCPGVGHILLTMWFIGPTVLFFFETEFHVKFYKLCYFNTTFLLEKKIRRYCLFEIRFSNGNHQRCPGVPHSGPAPRPQGAQLPHPETLAFSTPTLHAQLFCFEYSATLYLLSKCSGRVYLFTLMAFLSGRRESLSLVGPFH